MDQQQKRPASPTSSPRRSKRRCVTAPSDTEPWQEKKQRAENRLSQYESQGHINEEFLITTLKAALEWLPDRGQMADDILASQDDDTLWHVFEHFRSVVLLPIRSNAKTPRTMSPDPDPIADPEQQSSTFTSECLKRDDHRCVVSGAITEKTWKDQGQPPGVRSGRVEVYHIIPDSLGDDPDHISDVSSIHSIFLRLRSISTSRTENGITLHHQIHYEFQKFRKAFVPTNAKNQYNLKTYPGFAPLLRDARWVPTTPITLRQPPGHESIALPAEEFLDAHYRICEIWHASGMARESVSRARQWDEMKRGPSGHSLREDGSSDVREFLELALFG